MTEEQLLSAGQAVYWAGVVFSFGLRVGGMPIEMFWTDTGTALVTLITAALLSLFSWYSAGIFIGMQMGDF